MGPMRHLLMMLCPLLLLGCTTPPPDSGADLASPIDGGVDAAGCGDPVVIARYPLCRQTRDEAACVAAGGRWGRGGLSPQPLCLCPTGQDGCACQRASTCQAGCTAPLDNGATTCKDAVGRCESVGPSFGCKCIFNEKGEVSAICVD